jgi:methyl-accepting chemotaxis protein
MKQLFQRSLQARLIALFILPMVAIILFAAIYYPLNQRAAGYESARQRAHLLTEMLSFSIGAGLSDSNFELVQTAFAWARSDSTVTLVLIYDEQGNPIVEHNPFNVKVDHRTSSNVTYQLGDVTVAGAPIVYKNRTLGSAYVGVSLAPIMAGINAQIIVSLLINLVIAAAGITIVVVVARSLIGDLNAIRASIDNADLNTRFASGRLDEVGQMQNSFDRFVVSIRETLLQVSESATAVASASAEISSSTEEMAAGAHEQTAQATEVAGAVIQMAATIGTNTKNAAAAAETAKRAKAAAEQGGTVVNETVSGMKSIAEVVRQSASTVSNLGASSNQIGEIISVIDDIADQTNLLALNAAIEAARAGEQGRGFAVVADEVRRLAEKTATATKEIAAMIERIQADTKGAVRTMEEATKEVDQGIALADRAGASLREIVDISQHLTDMVTHIASASEQQAGSSQMISKSVEAITSVTQQTAAGTQEIARTAEDLNRLTEQLQQLVDRFQLRSNIGPSGTAKPAPSGRSSGGSRSTYAVRENGVLVKHPAAARPKA